MIVVTQNTVPSSSSVPLGVGVALPITAIKQVEFWQVMALADSAVVDTDATGPAKPALMPSDAADKPDKSESNTEQTISDCAALSILPQFLVVAPSTALDSPVPYDAASIAPPLRSLPQGEPSLDTVPEPVIPIFGQAKPALDQPPPKNNEAEGIDVLPQVGSAAPTVPEPGQPTAITQPTLPEATLPTVNLARQASTLSDAPNTAVPVVAGSRRSDTVPMKRSGADLTTVGVAGTVSKPQATQIRPINADDEPSRTTNEAPKPSIRPTPDAHMLSPKSNEPPSTAENAWRQKWISSDQPAVTEDAIVRDVLMGEQTTARAKGMSFDTTYDGTSQLGSGKLAVATTLPALTTAEPATAASLTAGKTTATLPDATVSLPTAATSTVLIVDAKPPENAVPDQRSFDAPGFMAAISLTTAAASQPTASPPTTIASGIPPAVTPAIVEMTKLGNDGPLELALSPEELGRVTISIRQDGDFVRVTLAAERPETLDLLRRHANDLVADLRHSGFSGASLSFGQGDQGQPARFAESSEDTNDQLLSSIPATSPPVPSRSRSGSGMDLRF
jgi:flagellar hook-length control protein FliK